MVPYGRKSGTERLKEKPKRKKNMIQGSFKEYQILWTRTSSKTCNEITTSFQIYKKVSTTTPCILFYLPNGGNLSKMLVF